MCWKEMDCVPKAKPQWNGDKRSVKQLRKNSIGLLQAHIEKGTCPNSLRYNVGQKSQMRILHKIYKLNQKGKQSVTLWEPWWNFTIIHSKASDVNKLAIELKAKVSEVNKLLVNLRAQKCNGEVESCTCAFSVSSETNNKGETTQKRKKD